ncbi:uncharacterized protein HKW66_Vig0252770 [Vigna angularis]|uniref:DUF7745 domain-containing protein n=1 Tax=Phaseolus angularis TaxID=3914 RepID=A0A8T0K503_PHAAN|nr:uncharacterized protein HKW66_Vig0252770 [Vigna angularis]
MLRNKSHLKTHGGNLTSLIKLGRRLKTIKRQTFKKRYGNLLSLMEVEVSSPAITAFAQYYDSPLRCFTFQDFQLAPTIEEFEHILGMPLEDTTPYQHLEHHASIATIAAIMKLHPKELEDRLVTRNQVRGLTQGFLEQHLHYLAEGEDWETFMDVLALTVYGIVLFPKVEGFVDYTAIDVFVAKKTRSENPVTAVLADVYGTMSFCHERKGKKILCCLSALYLWMTARLCKRSGDIRRPMEDPSHQGLKDKGGNEWAQFFASLNGGKVRWRLPWLETKPSIHYCSPFSNVPLIGTRYCINYNPILVQRQFGRPMKGAPSPEYLTTLFIYYEDGHFTEILRKVRSAWENVMRAEKDIRLGVMDDKINYHKWIWERVKEVKLPFKPIVHQLANEGPSQELESDEVKQLKIEMEKLREQNDKLGKELQTARNDLVDMRNDKEEKAQAYEEIVKSQKAERVYAFQLKQDLLTASKELAMRMEEKNSALEEGKQWRLLYEEAKRDKREALKRLREAQVQVEKAGHEMKEMALSFETDMNQERWKLAKAEEEHRSMIKQMEEYIEEQEEAVNHWKGNFSQLAMLANGAIEDIPKMVLDAEATTHFCNPPPEIMLFINHCKLLVGEMKAFTARARK